MTYVYIDTSVYESNNFIEGNKIKEFFNLSQQGEICIVISELTMSEIFNHASIKIKDGRTRLLNLKKEHRFLRNLEETGYIKPIGTEEDLFNIFKEKFQKILIDSKAKLIPYPTLNIKIVFNDYFNNHPPFNLNKKDKKSEFQDAFVIQIVEDWCIKNKTKCSFIAFDKDFSECKSDNITFINEYESFLNKLITDIAKNKRDDLIAKIKLLYENSKPNLEEKIKNFVQDILYDESEYYRYTHLEIHEIKLIDLSIELLDYQITSINEWRILLEAQVRIVFKVELEIDDEEQAWYDDEEKEMHYMDTTKDIIERDELFSLGLNVEIPEAGLEFMEIEIESINNDQSIIE